MPESILPHLLNAVKELRSLQHDLDVIQDWHKRNVIEKELVAAGQNVDRLLAAYEEAEK